MEDVLQDLISALLPTGALVVDPLMEATGILHAKHTLVVIPDDPGLMEFHREFCRTNRTAAGTPFRRTRRYGRLRRFP